MKCVNVRSGLPFTKKAIENGKLTFGVLGGSISENKVLHNWTVPFIGFLQEKYAGLAVIEENAAIGSTGSIVGLARMDKDIVSKCPDLVFVEYAVNDWNTPHAVRCAAMEGILRRLMEYGKCDIVLVYTFQKEMYPYLMQDELPPTVADYEKLAEHYNLNSAFVGAYVFNQNRAGLIKWQEWLPDNLHPQYRGSMEYARCIWETVQGGLCDARKVEQSVKPCYNYNWQNAEVVNLRELSVKHPFYISRCGRQAYVDYVVHTSAIGAEFCYDFCGTGIVFVFDFGFDSAEFDVFVDGKYLERKDRERPDWAGPRGWLFPTVIDGLENGRHSVKLVTKYGYADKCNGSEFDLAFMFVIK